MTRRAARSVATAIAPSGCPVLRSPTRAHPSAAAGIRGTANAPTATPGAATGNAASMGAAASGAATRRPERHCPDLEAQVAHADDEARKFLDAIDAFIEAAGFAGIPPDDVRGNSDVWTHPVQPPVSALDLD